MNKVEDSFLKLIFWNAEALSNHFITLEKNVSYWVLQQQEISDITEQEMESASLWSATSPCWRCEKLGFQAFGKDCCTIRKKKKIESSGHMKSPPISRIEQCNLYIISTIKSQNNCREKAYCHFSSLKLFSMNIPDLASMFFPKKGSQLLY